MTVADVPNFPTWQMCRLRWKFGDYAGNPLDKADVSISSSVMSVDVPAADITLLAVFPSASVYNGYLRNIDGDPWVDVVASGDPDISPTGWTITISIRVPASGLHVAKTFTVTLVTPPGGDINLRTLLSVSQSVGTAPARYIVDANSSGLLTFSDGTSVQVAQAGPAGPSLTPDPANLGYYLIGA